MLLLPVLGSMAAGVMLLVGFRLAPFGSLLVVFVSPQAACGFPFSALGCFFLVHAEPPLVPLPPLSVFSFLLSAALGMPGSPLVVFALFVPLMGGSHVACSIALPLRYIP